jgi:hypothetical protein
MKGERGSSYKMLQCGENIARLEAEKLMIMSR